MSKLANDFGRVFRGSKLAQLANNQKSTPFDPSKSFPTHQIIESLPSSYSRRDFGLKMRLPKRLKTRRIVVNDLDNKYGMPDYEPLNGFYWKKQRFREMGVPVKAKSPGNGKHTANPLFPEFTTQSAAAAGASQTIASVLDIQTQPINSHKFKNQVKPDVERLRRPFLRWLAQTYPERLDQTDLTEELSEFLKTDAVKSFKQGRDTIPESYGNRLSGTAGLSYQLGGRLSQTPNGVEASKVVPGRWLQSRVSANLFGVGGFVGQSSVSPSRVKYLGKLNNTVKPILSTGKFGREFKVPVVTRGATLDLDAKKLSISVEPVRAAKRRATGGTSLSSIRNSISPRSPLGGIDKDETSVLNSLLGLLESVDKKK